MNKFNSNFYVLNSVQILTLYGKDVSLLFDNVLISIISNDPVISRKFKLFVWLEI